jgi:gluconate 2-dehydrogenase gamma chain
MQRDLGRYRPAELQLRRLIATAVVRLALEETYPMSDGDALPHRRSFLKGAFVPAAALLGGGADAIFPRAAAADSALAIGNYQPKYFTDAEWNFINAATDRLIPSNADGPGAVDLHVPEFIDRQMETDYGHGALWYLQGPFNPDAAFTLGYQLRYSPRDLYRAAIPELNAWCLSAHGKAFADLDGSTQDEVLGLLQKGGVALPSVKASEFFIQLLANTKEGYFADPMYGGNRNMGSWKMIGFPGARADFKDWMTQPGKVYPLGPVSILGEKA